MAPLAPRHSSNDAEKLYLPLRTGMGSHNDESADASKTKPRATKAKKPRAKAGIGSNNDESGNASKIDHRTTKANKSKAKAKPKPNARAHAADPEVELLFAPPPTCDSYGRPLPSVQTMNENFMRNIMRGKRGKQGAHEQCGEDAQTHKDRRMEQPQMSVQTERQDEEEEKTKTKKEKKKKKEEEKKKKEEEKNSLVAMSDPDSPERERVRGYCAAPPVTDDASNQATCNDTSDPQTLVNESLLTLSGRNSANSNLLGRNKVLVGNEMEIRIWSGDVNEDADERKEGAEILMGMQQGEGVCGRDEIERLENEKEGSEKERRNAVDILARMARGEGPAGP